MLATGVHERKDKFHFAKLSRKYKDELRDFFVANLVDKDYWLVIF